MLLLLLGDVAGCRVCAGEVRADTADAAVARSLIDAIVGLIVFRDNSV